jgi:hypothetical protein
MALLIGAAWIELAQAARRSESRGQSIAARSLLQAQWVVFFVAAAVAPIVARDQVDADRWPWCLVIGLLIATAVPASARSWRRGGSSIALAPLAAACAVGFLVAYGLIAPQENAARGHRTVAAKLDRIVSGAASTPTLMFYNEIDEGLWFYAKGFRLAPVPETHPHYNTAFDLAHSFLGQRRHSRTLAALEAERVAREKQALLEWLDRREPVARYLLIRDRQYDLFAAELAARTRLVLRETSMKRNELVLLEVTGTQTAHHETSQTHLIRR